MKMFIVSFVLLSGCISSTSSISIESTKQWEGHYFTVEQFKTNTNDITLDQDETIWVLSDKTLSRVLKRVSK